MKATEKQLDRIADLRLSKNMEYFNGNVNELYSEYISEFTADCLIGDLEALPEVGEAYEEEPTKFKVGDIVTSPRYGDGTVTGIDGKIVKVKTTKRLVMTNIDQFELKGE